MPKFTERTVESFSCEQAAALLRVLDAHAAWDQLLAAGTGPGAGLIARQWAHEVYRAALKEYARRYGGAAVPVSVQGVPERVSQWCKVLRVVLRRRTRARGRG